MKLDIEKAATDESPQSLSYLPKTSLGERLLAIREKIVASGETLFDRDEIEKEIAARRGERHD